MTTDQKIIKVKDIMKQMLGNFTTLNNIKIPTTFILDNEEPNNFFNVISVDSKEQAESISMALVNTKEIVDNVKNYSEPLYLTVIANIPL